MLEESIDSLEKIGALWRNTSRKNETYLSGAIGEEKILIFRNAYKEEGTNAPDYKIYKKKSIEKKPEEQTEKPREKFVEDDFFAGQFAKPAYV